MNRPNTLRRRALLTWIAAGLLAALLAGPAWAAPMAAWEKPLYQGALKEKEFTVYTAHYPTEIIANICKGFEKRYAGIKCNFVRTTAQVAYTRLQQDMQGGIKVASVFSTTDVSHMPPLKQKGLLLQYKPHNLANMVPALLQYNDKDNYYWVTSAGLVLINYNTQLVSEKDAPKKWTDLLDPKWKDKVTIGHPGFSGYVGTWVVLMRKMYGWDYFEKLEKNRPQIGRSINDTVTMLNAKERQVGAGPDATTLLSRDKGNPLGVIYPEDGTLLMISPSAILKDAPAPNCAKLFVEYLLDKEAAEIQAKDRAQVVIKGVRALPGAKSMDEVKVTRPTEEEIAKGIPEVIEKFRDTFGI